MDINGSKYKAVAIEKMVVNGKEQSSTVISVDQTKGIEQLNVIVYTKADENTMDGKDNTRNG